MATSRLLGAIAAMATGLVAGLSSSAQARDLTLVNWGGPPQVLQRELYYTPFTQETKIPVLEDSWTGGYGILKAKVDSKQINWDIVQVESDEEALGCADGIYEKLDWSQIGDRQSFYPGTATDCGVGTNVYAFVLAYNGDKVAEAPTGWGALWDVNKYPGKRSMRKGAKGTLEIALLADGVPIDKVYEVLRTPEGVDRSFKKLDQIKSDIIWWESTAQVMQLLSSGEVAMGEAYDAPVTRVIKNDNSPLKIVWSDSLRATDYWVILKGSPFTTDAMKLVAFMSRAENLAKYAERLPVGVPNAKAMTMVRQPVSDLLLSSPKNYEQSYAIDKDFWLDNGEELTRRFNAWLAQ